MRKETRFEYQARTERNKRRHQQKREGAVIELLTLGVFWLTKEVVKTYKQNRK